ncbi:MAG: MlaD family protein [Paludibacteraceae bacterium]|nr:MlaD family protein [Paludibacteraceae bacterium]
MKHAREIKVALLAIVCGFLLYFGMYFLRGVNIFSPVGSYVGVFERVNGLTEQAPVYVRGYNVGQVDKIEYDFSRHDAFKVNISIDKHIVVPEGSEMVLVADGIMGGKAIEVVIPVTEGQDVVPLRSDTLPTRIEQGLVETLETGLMAHLDSVLLHVDSVVSSVEHQLEGDHISHTLGNLDRITQDLTVSAADIRQMTHQRLPKIADSAAVVIDNANAVLANVKEADIAGVVKKANATIGGLQQALESKESTIGLLLHDPSIYNHLDSAVVSVDQLVTDLKENPKRYVHFSVFGSKDKSKEKEKGTKK